MLGRGNSRTLFCEFEPFFLMMSCRRVQAVPPSPVTSGLSVKKPGGLCLRSLQLDLPLQSLPGQNLTAGRRCSEDAWVGYGHPASETKQGPAFLEPFPSNPFPCPHLSPGYPESPPKLCSVQSLLPTSQEKPVWATSPPLSTQASHGAVPGGAGGCFACSWSKSRPLKAPQTQGWHIHSSLYCGEGRSSERQLFGGQSFAIRSLLH